VHIARGVVIRIKEEGVLRDFRAVARHPDFDDERLEEPGRVREMPLRRADVGHRLHDEIFRLQIPAEAGAEVPHLLKTVAQTLGAIACAIVSSSAPPIP
jgi:hypothetical protein